MARSLLIALLAVVAVAGPVAAQGDPLGLPDLPTSLDEPVDAGAAASALGCDPGPCAATSIATCGRPVSFTLPHSFPPEFDLEVDPDNCLDKVWGWVEEKLPPREGIAGLVDRSVGWVLHGSDEPAAESGSESTSPA